MGEDGGCVVAMHGKGCVAIATDHYFGIDGMTVATNCKKVFYISSRMFVGLAGYRGDALTVLDHLLFRKNIHELRENREIEPKTLSAMLSHLLYERRFGPYLLEPIVAGLHPRTMEPFICGMDAIGYQIVTDNFAVSGACSEGLYGMCETLWRPNLKPDILFEVIAQSIKYACESSTTCGYGATAYVIEPDKITERGIKTRMD